MTEFLLSSESFCLILTIAAFVFASFLQKKTKLVILNPILIAALLIIAVLLLLDIPNETYQKGNQILRFLMTPATICLAISFYQQFQALKHHIPAITAGVLAGSISSICFVYLAARVFRLDMPLMLSLLPKSVTSAIGAVVSQEIGGLSALTTFAIIITGVLGNIIGPVLCRIFRIQDPIAQGVAFGTATHVIGTAKAVQMNKLTGAVSSLSLTLAGLITVVFLSFLTSFL